MSTSVAATPWPVHRAETRRALFSPSVIDALGCGHVALIHTAPPVISVQPAGPTIPNDRDAGACRCQARSAHEDRYLCGMPETTSTRWIVVAELLVVKNEVGATFGLPTVPIWRTPAARSGPIAESPARLVTADLLLEVSGQRGGGPRGEW